LERSEIVNLYLAQTVSQVAQCVHPIVKDLLSTSYYFVITQPFTDSEIEELYWTFAKD